MAVTNGHCKASHNRFSTTLIYIYRYMMYYLMWRVLTGLHEEVKISFLPVGHTKFSPDWCFGLMKQHFRSTKFGDLDDIVNCVNLPSFVNVSQLVGSSVFIKTYNWSEHFEEHTIKVHHAHLEQCSSGQLVQT